MLFHVGDKVKNSLSDTVGFLMAELPDGFMDVDYGNGPKKTHPSRLTVVKSSAPRSLRIQNLKPEYIEFLGYLQTPEANCLLTLEAQCPEMDFAVRQQYRKLTGEELQLGRGYNVAPESAKKQGCEGSVTFVVPPMMPAELKDAMVQRPGLINRIDFVWMLVQYGFRVAR